MEKVSYQLLRKLYKFDSLDSDTVNKLTKYYNKSAYNPRLSLLREEKMISQLTKEEKANDGSGRTKETTYYQITIRGRDYVERKRKDAFSFWLPYTITTLIAVGSLALTLFSLIGKA